MFLFKKIVAPLFFPLPFCLLLLFLGLAFLWCTKRQRAGKVFVSVAVGLLFLLGYGVPAGWLMARMEQAYPPYPGAEDDGTPAPQYVVVLAAGHASDPRLPITGQLGPNTIIRLVEGIRIYRRHAGCRLVLSGGAPFDTVPAAGPMSALAVELGVPPSDITVETQSRDTKDQAQAIRQIVGNGTFVLVTSASHMPRSVGMFRKVGLKPIPAPTGHWIKEAQQTSPGAFYPSAGGLRLAEATVYEYLGYAWAKMRGQI